MRGFLELVRYGIRKPGDPLIEDSLRGHRSQVCKVETPCGPCWRRYNHDGYGQRDDGGPYLGWGRGRAWPLLTGERGHYELAAGRDRAALLPGPGTICRHGLLPRTDLGRGRHARRAAVAGRPDRLGHAAGLGACRIPDAGAFGGRRPGVRSRPEVAARYQTGRAPARTSRSGNPTATPARSRRAGRCGCKASDEFCCTGRSTSGSSSKTRRASDHDLGCTCRHYRLAADQRSPVRFTFFWYAEIAGKAGTMPFMSTPRA